jgi:hypothetical protein
MNEDRPIEKLLRRAAEKRNAEMGPPPELHPANRRLLQAEVAQQFPRSSAPEPAPRRAWWSILSQRWAFAVGLFIVLGLATIALWPMLTPDKSVQHFSHLLPPETVNEPTEALPQPVVTFAPAASGPATSLEADRSLPSGGGNFIGADLTAGSSGVTAPDSFARNGFSEPAVRSVPAAPSRESVSQPAIRTGRVSEPTATPAPLVAGWQDSETSFRRTPAAEADGRLALSSAPPTSRAFKAVGSEPQPLSRPVPPVIDSDASTEATFTTGTRAVESRTVAPRDLAINAVTDEADADASALGVTAGEPRLDEAKAKAAATFSGQLASTAPRELEQVAAVRPPVRNEGTVQESSWQARGGGEESPRVTANSQVFRNVGTKSPAPAKLETAPAAATPVLANFRIEQQGPHVRVIDGDGSVYRGYVDEANTVYKQVVAQKEQAANLHNRARLQSPRDASATTGVGQQQMTNFYFYRVEGTNRSLNQNVVFTWNFAPTNEAIAAAQKHYNDNLLNSTPEELPSQFPELLQNSFINGRAQLGESRQYEINAVPLPQ